MKQIRIFIFSILFPAIILNSLYAQQKYCEINVQDGKEPLEYANIFINGKYFGCTDSLGTVIITSDAIHKGDTVSVSYIGMNPEMFIYDTQSRYVFHLSISSELPAVIKTARSISLFKFYKKNLHINLPPKRHKYKYNYKSVLCRNGIEVLLQSGQITVNNEGIRQGGELACKITKHDIEKGNPSVARYVLFYKISFITIFNIYNFTYSKKNFPYIATLKYHGKTDRQMYFSWNYFYNGTTNQTIIHADRESKLLSGIERHFIYETGRLLKLICHYKYDKKKQPYIAGYSAYLYDKPEEPDTYTLWSLYE